MQNYMDWLKANWKPNMEFLKAEGWLLSYHIMAVNDRRDGEPHLILVQEWRDYPTTAQTEEMNNKWLARQRSNQREAATQNGAPSHAHPTWQHANAGIGPEVSPFPIVCHPRASVAKSGDLIGLCAHLPQGP